MESKIIHSSGSSNDMDMRRLLEKPKMNNLLALLCTIVLRGKTGKLECNFSQGGLTRVDFTERKI